MKSLIYGVHTPMIVCMGYKMADCHEYLSTAGYFTAYALMNGFRVTVRQFMLRPLFVVGWHQNKFNKSHFTT